MLYTRVNHWSCTRFARWVTSTCGGIPKPEAETLEGWARWNTQAQAANPASYWFTETALPKLQNLWCWPSDRLRDAHLYLYNRFVSKTHYAQTGLTPGQYYSIDHVMLHALFNLLVDFVEGELAWRLVTSEQEASARYAMPWWSKWQLLRWREWRCPAAGLEYLDWEAALVQDYDWLPEQERAMQPEYGQPTTHALAAKEQLELYLWWTRVRPARLDPYRVPAWVAYVAHQKGSPRAHRRVRTEQQKRQGALAQASIQALVEGYAREDEQMMIRLIKIRKQLWA